MDYQVFSVRISGGVFGPGIGKGDKVLRVLDSSLSVSSLAATPNGPASLEITFESISNVLPSTKDERELTLNVPDGNGKGCETFHIYCDARSKLMTTLLNRMDDLNGIGTDFCLRKYSHDYGGLVETVLRVRSASVVKMLSNGERRRVNIAKKFNFDDIVKVQVMADDDHIVLLHLNSRMLRLSITDSAPFFLALSRNMKFYLNRDLDVEKITTERMVDNVATFTKQVKSLPFLFEFHVMKQSESKAQGRTRTLYVSKEHFVEMAGDEIVAIHCLNDINGLVVNDKNINEVAVEFKSSQPAHYLFQERESFIASIAEVASTAKTSVIDVRPVPLSRLLFPDQFEYEGFYINRFMNEFHNKRDPVALHMTLKELASNIRTSHCADYKVVCAVAELLKDWSLSQDFVRSTTCCIVISRLLSSRFCFDAVKNMTSVISVLIQCFRSENAILVYTASVALRATVKFSGESHGDPSAVKQEQHNKLIALSLENMQQFASLLHTYCLKKGHLLQAYGMLKLLATGLDNVALETENLRAWMKAFESSLMVLGDIICVLSRSRKAVLRESAAVLLEALMGKTSTIVASHFQTLFLKRCLVIVHLYDALFSRTDASQSRSARLLFRTLEGNEGSKHLLQSIFPKGAFHFYNLTTSELRHSGKDASASRFCAWIQLLEILRRDTIETPLFIWNDMKKLELMKFLEKEMQGFDTAATINHVISYNYFDVSFTYSTESEGKGTVVGDVHLELLVDHSPPDDVYASLWKVQSPLALFQTVFQALVLGFTPFFGRNNTPEVDLRLAVHVLTKLYERYALEIAFCLQTSNVIETCVGMLYEVIETEHQVFVFKLTVFLLTLMEVGGRENVLRFLRAGGATVLVSILVLSLNGCCKMKTEFESDGWSLGKASILETVEVVNYNGEMSMVRVPSGRVREVLGKALSNGSLDAKEAIKWQDAFVPSKIQFGMALDVLEAIFRICGSDNGPESFPPSAACLAFSQEEILCHLVQSLLRAKTPAFGRILNILSHLTKTSKSALMSIQDLGAYEILLWKLLAGDITDSEKKLIITFLRQAHLPLASEACCSNDLSPCENSALRFYLPEGLILKLITEDADGFLMLLKSEQDNPEVVWNTNLVKELSNQLTRHLEPYVRSRTADPMAIYIHVPLTIVYEELADVVYSEPFYLHNLLDTERFSNYPINDPVKFLNNLMKSLRQLASDFMEATANNLVNAFWRKELSRISFLLRSLVYLLERFQKLVPPKDMEAVVLALAIPLFKTFEGQELLIPDTIFQATRILRATSDMASRSTDSNGSLNFALDIISLAADMTASKEGDVFNNVIEGAFLILEVICRSRAGRLLLRDELRWNKGLWWALCTVFDSITPFFAPAEVNRVLFSALSCLRHFADHEELLEFFKQGLHLPLILLTFFSVSNAAVTLLAADITRCLSESEFSSALLKRMIPEPLLVCLSTLEGIERLMALRASDFARPTAIWDDRVRLELRERLHERIRNRHTSDELEWLRGFSYSCLSSELAIGGFYIKGLISCTVDEIDFDLESTLVAQLLEFLVRHRKVGIHGTVYRDTDNISMAEYISVLTALEGCIKYALKRNMTPVLRGCDLSAGLSSIILHDVLDLQVQAGIASICRALITGGMIEVVVESQLLEALSLQLWEASLDAGMDNVLRSTLETLYALGEHLPATVRATNYFSSQGTLLPLMALFCDVKLPSLRESGTTSKTSPSFGNRLMAAKVLGQLLLAGKGVTRRGKLIKDLEQLKQNTGEDIDQATDMYELFSVVAQSSELPAEAPVVLKSLLLLLPLDILSALARDPNEACKAYDGSFSNLNLVWDEPRRHQVKMAIVKEAARVRTMFTKTGTLSAWSFDSKRPVFLRWILLVTTEDDGKPAYRQDYAEDYAKELYLGGFFVDHFLRNHRCSLDPISQERFLHELRTALVVGSSPDGFSAEVFTLDDRRRLILALLILLRLHPRLLSCRSNIDIFLPLYELMSSDSRVEKRALSQPAMLLLYCTTTHPDMADCIISEELIFTLASYLSLRVPPQYAGDFGTDPRLCSLCLLSRLMRLSSITVELVMKLGVVSMIEDLVLDFNSPEAVKKKAAECLASMCADKRKGSEVRTRLDKLIPSKVKGYGSWKLHVTRIQDDIVEMTSLDYFLRHRQPSPWWTSDTSEGIDPGAETVGAVSVVEGSLCFARARISDFNSEAEVVFIRTMASAACVELRAVRIVRKRIGSIIVDFEVSFRKQTQERAEITANSFKEILQAAGNDFFANTMLETMGPSRITSVVVKPVEIYGQKDCHNGPALSVGDKNVIYVPTEQKTDSPHTPCPVSRLMVSHSSDPSAISATASFANFLRPSSDFPDDGVPIEKVLVPVPGLLSTSSIKAGHPPPPPPPPPPPLSILPPVARPQATAKKAEHPDHKTKNLDVPKANGHSTYNGNGYGASANGNGAAAMTNGNGHSNMLNGNGHSAANGAGTTAKLSNPTAIVITSEEGKLVSLDAGLELVLEGAEVGKEQQRVAKINFLDAFEDELEELGNIVEKYPKLLQKFPLQPQLCYDLVVAWEEHCIDLLTADELTKYGRSIASYDMSRTDNADAAIQEAKRKFQGILKARKDQEWKDKTKQLKGDMSAELAKAVGERKERLITDVVNDELELLSTGKVRTRRKEQS